MAKPILPSPELQAALCALLGLENLNNVRTVKISIGGGEPVKADVEMFVWQHDRLSSVVHQLTADPERVTNVKIEVTPTVARASYVDDDLCETDERDLIP